MICNDCGGRGERVQFYMTRVLPCSKCRGKGVVPDFCFASLEHNGVATYRALSIGGEPWRYTLEGAREYAREVRYGSDTHKPNAVIRVYLK